MYNSMTVFTVKCHLYSDDISEIEYVISGYPYYNIDENYKTWIRMGARSMATCRNKAVGYNRESLLADAIIYFAMYNNKFYVIIGDDYCGNWPLYVQISICNIISNGKDAANQLDFKITNIDDISQYNINYAIYHPLQTNCIFYIKDDYSYGKLLPTIYDSSNGRSYFIDAGYVAQYKNLGQLPVDLGVNQYIMLNCYTNADNSECFYILTGMISKEVYFGIRHTSSTITWKKVTTS